MTKEGLAEVVQDCKDEIMQSGLAFEFYDLMWPADNEVPALIFEPEDIVYIGEGFQMDEVLDMSWAACCWYGGN